MHLLCQAVLHEGGIRLPRSVLLPAGAGGLLKHSVGALLLLSYSVTSRGPGPKEIVGEGCLVGMGVGRGGEALTHRPSEGAVVLEQTSL